MSVRGWLQHEVTNPRGAWTASALTRKPPPERAAVAQNVRFSPGKVYSREGLSNTATVLGKVTGMYNWLSPTDNFVIYMEGTAIKALDLTLATGFTLLTGVTGRAPSFADLGPRLYFAAWDTSNNGTIQCRIYDGTFTNGSPDVDLAFRGPLQFISATAADTGPGQCTKGTHKLGLIFQSRSGFSGAPSPVNAFNVFQPVSITLNAGNRNIRLSITLNTPADAGTGSAIYVIMTRANNPDEWFFVDTQFVNGGGVVTLPPSAAGWTQTFDISVSDDNLVPSRSNSAAEQFNLLTANQSGVGPFSPSVVYAFGKRMCYVVGSNVYVSDINDPQHLTADNNIVEMLNKRRVVTVFHLGNTLFLTGDKWTGHTSDNGDFPSTWPQPAVDSDALGAPFPGCLEWKTAGDYAWIATETGLYLFNGRFPGHPVSYFNTDIWKRINWSAASTIQIADDTVNLKCFVAVPLDGATEPTNTLVYDYTNSIGVPSYDTVDFSIDNYDVATFSSIRMVKEFATNRTALWIGSSAAGSIAHLDPTTVNDRGTAFRAIWRSGYVRPRAEIEARTIRVGNAHLWMRGSGTMIQTWAGLDNALIVHPPNLTLLAAPGQEYYSKVDLNPVENYTFQFETNGVSDWFELSGFTAYAKPSRYVR